MADGDRIPVRLVQENGDTISLDATSIDMVVERQQSAFGIPLQDAKKMAIDLNQAMVGFEIQGIFADDKGQEASSKAKAVVDFNHTQTLYHFEQETGFGGANTGGAGGLTSASNRFGGVFGGSSGSGNSPGTLFAPTLRRPLNFNTWHKKYMALPVAYWVSQNINGLAGLPITSGLSARFNADSLSATNMVGGSLDHNAQINTWVDTASSILATPSGTPLYRKHGANGKPYVYFDGSSKFSIPFNSNLNPTEMTIFTVAQTTNDNGALQSIITSQEGTGAPFNDRGFTVYYNMTGSENEARLDVYYGGTGSMVSGNGTVEVGEPKILSGVIPNSVVIDSELFFNGTSKSTTTDEYSPALSATAYIGAGYNDGSLYPFVGNIYEILIYNRILTDDERFLVEGYLSNKYNIALNTNHKHKFFSFREDSDSIRVVFDTEHTASKNEPYGFVNKPRPMTGITVSSATGFSATSIDFTINTTGGDPREWLEVTNSNSSWHIKIKDPATGEYRANSAGTEMLILVRAVTSNSISCTRIAGFGSNLVSSDEIHLAPLEILGEQYKSPEYGNAILVLPIQNAFASTTQNGQDLTFVEYPNYEDGTARTEGLSQIPTHSNTRGQGKRSDEYITYQFSQLISSSSIQVSDRAVNADGDKTMDKVFSTTIETSGDGFKTRLVITQEYATSLGKVNNKIRHNFMIGNLPTVQGFTGGKAGKRVKSAGDKAQDLLGILANSNNFEMTPVNTSIGGFVRGVANFISQPVYGTRETSDYIYGIQIPYISKVTKGDNSLDAIVAQRNHWITVENTDTVSKMAASNVTHASSSYNIDFDNSRRNGIHGLITEFNISRDAENKVYEFALKFVAANVII